MSVIIASKTLDDGVTCGKHASPHPSEYGGGYNTRAATTSNTWGGLPSVLMLVMMIMITRMTTTLSTMLAHAIPPSYSTLQPKTARTQNSYTKTRMTQLLNFFKVSDGFELLPLSGWLENCSHNDYFILGEELRRILLDAGDHDGHLEREYSLQGFCLRSSKNTHIYI